MMLARLLAPTAAALAVLASTAAPAEGYDGRAPSGSIVAARYSAENDGYPQIVSVRPGDGRVRAITSGSQDVAPDLSPDGRSIVFDRCLHAVNCDEIGAHNIWIMGKDGSHQHPLTACDGTKCLGAFTPSFSPDGRLIAFGEDLLNADGVNFNGIFVMRADGSHARRITSNGPDNLPDDQPQFSPDGKHLAFERELATGSELMTVRVDGQGLRPILPGVNAYTPNWAPDGRHLVFVLAGGTEDSPTFSIAVVRPNGTDRRLLTDTPPEQPAFAPDYSPQGRHIVFSQADVDGCHLVVTGLNADQPRTLPTGPGCFVDSSWGPNRR